MSEINQSTQDFHFVLKHDVNNTSIPQENKLISSIFQPTNEIMSESEMTTAYPYHFIPNTQTWEQAAKSLILPIRCNGTKGLLYKEKFGSGGKGKCIKYDDGDVDNNIWCTPLEFEKMSGRGNGKDWKRSISFGGRNLKTLILKKYIVLHSTACVCAICSNDPNSTSPIRHFIPYYRQKKCQNINEDMNGQKHNNIECSNIGTSNAILGLTSSINSLNENLMKINHGVLSCTQDNWKIISDVVDNLVKSSTILKSVVQEMKEKSNEEMNNLIVRSQLQNSTTQTTNVQNSIPVPDYPKVVQILDSNQIIYTCIIESPLLPEESNNIKQLSESNSNNVLTNCENCGRYGGLHCSGCRVVYYCSTFCQNKDWPIHRASCQVQVQPECREESHLAM